MLMTIDLSAQYAAALQAQALAAQMPPERFINTIVQRALSSPSDQHDPVEQWLCTEVVESYDHFKANPDSGIPLDEAFASLKKRLKTRPLSKQSR